MRPAGIFMMALVLGGCAAQHVPPPLATATPLTGHFVHGTVAAVRDAGAAQGTAGLSAVLAALNQPPVPDPLPAQEIVIRRADSGVTTLVQQPPPDGDALRAGDNVAVITAAATIVKRE